MYRICRSVFFLLSLLLVFSFAGACSGGKTNNGETGVGDEGPTVTDEGPGGTEDPGSSGTPGGTTGGDGGTTGGTTSESLTPPQNVTVVSDDGALEIEWDSVEGAGYYNLYWSNSSDITSENSTKYVNVESPYTHTGIEKGENYYYVVTAVDDTGESEFSDEVSSMIPHLFVIYGDSRSNHEEHQAVVDAIVGVEPDVVFHTGDLVADGRVLSQWANFNAITAEMRNMAEFFPVLGNHEYDSDYYFDNFELLNNERWYSLDRSGIHFIVLDSNHGIPIGSDQYEWLEDDLESIGDDIDYTIVIFHHPPYSSGPHWREGESMGLRDSIVPLFDQHGVDVVFNGHDHAYEKLKRNGIYYIVAGGGGAPLYSLDEENEYSELYIKTLHFCMMELEDGKLQITVFDENSDEVDSFEVGG
jgi:3',5'-cyclic AMP phosphodiesterase CpdA